MYLISPNISLFFLEFRVVKQKLLSFTATPTQLKSKITIKQQILL